MIKADDGDGHTDTATVEILTAKPTAEPTPEEPGFEAVFAKFFASQKPLLKMLRHCRSVSDCVPGAEEKEVRAKGERQNEKCKIFRFFFIPFFVLFLHFFFFRKKENYLC